MKPMLDYLKSNPWQPTYRHPRIMFKPDRQVMQTMIKAVCMYGDSETEYKFFLRFGLLDYHNRNF
jgi:hypothetical protein